MRVNAVLRIRIMTGFILCFALVLLGRLYQLQIIEGNDFRELAERQYVHTVRELYSRGSIYLTTKNGERVSAAMVQSGFLLAVDPTRLLNIDDTYAALNSVTPIDREAFILRAGRSDRTYQEIKQQVTAEEAAKIELLGLPGVQLYRSQWRYYPGKALSARTIGFVGYKGDTLAGVYGLERYYDDVLMRTGERLSVDFFAELFSSLGDLVFDRSTAHEGDVVTSLEPTVARTLDRILEETQQTYNSAMTGGIIIDPRTGSIYALGVMPTFDLNDRGDIDINEFKNPLVEDVYEMGSIIKPLTVASGLDSGAITARTTYYDGGYIDLDTYTIRNFDGKGRGYVDMQQVLNQSLNTGVAHIVSLMGKTHFRDYFLKLRLGSETGIDLPNEVHGLVKNLESPRDVEYATASFGQGIALTPIATVRALSSLANGGTLITPHIASRVEYEDGSVREVGFPDGERVFSEATSEEITRMLVRVVDEALRGGTVALPHYTIAAKTGTAQMADPVNGGYYEDRFLHSFFGYFPAYEPQFMIFLYTVEPKGVRFASETLTEPFMELTRFLINYYALPPDR